ncbi:MAG: homoserine kinase [Candidatus Eremiobacteraeota bacterium]|nr:homoserine kinase [Candidatus Eremiobacteraeota bacterium]
MKDNCPRNREFTVYVPATSANLGPGYDVIGVALDIYNEFHVTMGGTKKLDIEIEGEGADAIPRDENNLIYKSTLAGCKMAGVGVPNIRIHQKNAIPLNRGMGSSATAVLGGLMIAREIAGDRLEADDMISLAIDIEGHPDNLMAAYMGGVVINYKRDGIYRGVKFIPPEPLRAVLVVPDIQVSTKMARELLPDSYKIKDVVSNLGNISLLIHALHTGQYRLLREAMEDTIHQPYRAELIPGFNDVVESAKKSGAWGCAISGSGSTVIAFCSENGNEIAEAMKNAFKKHSVNSVSMITDISDKGACLEVG